MSLGNKAANHQLSEVLAQQECCMLIGSLMVMILTQTRQFLMIKYYCSSSSSIAVNQFDAISNILTYLHFFSL